MEDCGRKHRSKGLCGLHYARMLNAQPKPELPPFTLERVKELLDYDPETGLFARKLPSGRRVPCSTRLNSWGYVLVGVDRRSIGAHRLAWFYMTGEWPEDDVDHRDRNRANNRFDNLRPASRAENMQNLGEAHRDSAIPLLGVSRKRGRFAASIAVDGKRKYLGAYGTPKEAHEAYLAAKRELHPAGNI